MKEIRCSFCHSDKPKLMKKQIANIVTGSRGILSVPLLFLPFSSVWFYTLYLFCGLTDMVDGRIARMTGAANRFGARLDTVSDFIFLLVCSVRLLPILQIPNGYGFGSR